MIDVIAIGGATIDLFFKSDDFTIKEQTLQFVHGEKFVVDNFTQTYGGGGVNAAVCFARLGLRSGLLTHLSSDFFGDKIIENLANEHVDLSLLNRDDQLKTAVSSILLDQTGERTIIMYRGQTDTLAGATIDQETFLSAKWLYICDSYTTDLSLQRKLMALVRERGAKVVFVPSQRQLQHGITGMTDLLAETDVFILNRYEASLLTGLTDEKQTVEDIAKLGPAIVIITKDSEGVIAYANGVHYKEPANNIPIVDTTGAGDAFASTFVTCLQRSIPLQEALHLACKNAESVISHIGSQPGLLSQEQLFG